MLDSHFGSLLMISCVFIFHCYILIWFNLWEELKCWTITTNYVYKKLKFHAKNCNVQMSLLSVIFSSRTLDDILKVFLNTLCFIYSPN